MRGICVSTSPSNKCLRLTLGLAWSLWVLSSVTVELCYVLLYFPSKTKWMKLMLRRLARLSLQFATAFHLVLIVIRSQPYLQWLVWLWVDGMPSTFSDELHVVVVGRHQIEISPDDPAISRPCTLEIKTYFRVRVAIRSKIYPFQTAVNGMWNTEIRVFTHNNSPTINYPSSSRRIVIFVKRKSGMRARKLFDCEYDFQIVCFFRSVALDRAIDSPHTSVWVISETYDNQESQKYKRRRFKRQISYWFHCFNHN